MVPEYVKKEIKAILSSTNGKRRMRFASNFSTSAWPYILKMSDADLFTVLPPEKLSTKGNKVGQYKSKCLICGSKTRFITYRVGYARICANPKCVNEFTIGRESDEHKAERMRRTQDTMMRRYGARCSAAAGLQDLTKTLHTKETIAKRTATSRKKYGTPGKRTAEQKAILKERVERANCTLLETRLKNPDIFRKQTYQRQVFKIQGAAFSVQGYERHAIEHLVNSGRTRVESITISPKGFKYIEHGKSRAYLPDFEAKISNKWFIVEVKSVYTLGTCKSGKTMFYNLRRKSKAVVDGGYRFLTMVYLEKTDELVEIENIHEYSIQEIRSLVQQ